MSRRSKVSICSNCKKRFYSWYSSYGIYCSLACQKKYQEKLNINEWLSGIVNPINTNGLMRPWARRYLFKINGDKCSKCGWGEVNQYTNKIPLEVDHVDGNFRNNNLANLRLLCPNCHSLTETYKGLNKGKGRRKRVVNVK